MIEALGFSFVQNALLAGFLVSIACGIVGSLVVANRMVFIAGGIAHGAYGGLGIAFFVGVSPLFGALAFSLVLALALAYLTYQNRNRVDAVIGAIWAFGMAVGIICVDLTSGYNADLMSFLFGSILSVSKEDLTLMWIVCALIVAIVGFFYKEFLAVSFDMEFASLQGLNTKFFYTLLILITALCIVATIRAVGLILVVALLSIPPYIAEKFCSKLITLMGFSVLLSVIFTFVGLVLSYMFNLTSGASIIMVASLAFGLTYIKMSFFGKHFVR
ncbi:MAG: metal ABC transporter permease [Campylobacteraceae bacterium]|jgi:zinc transport system permease protein|nr:metal ABC transporter permease [Campylobacteraceae bacterium]